MAGRRLTIVQYAGDFREAEFRLEGGGPETYRAQRHSVGYVQRMAGELEAVATITAKTDLPYDEVLPSGVRAIGGGNPGRVDYGSLIRLIEATSPDMLVVRSPMRPVLRWAARSRCRTMALLADSFDPRRPKSRLALWLLVRLLRQESIDVVANHGRGASRQLVAAGVPGKKVIPWDYPQVSPSILTPKTKAAAANVIYVGTISKAKGVFDLLRAVSNLRSRRPTLRLSLLGSPCRELHQMVHRLRLEGVIEIAGAVPNDQVIARMRQADVVVVPSRHEYPEGMPLTIYEALASRTPLVVSDHPMFTGSIEDGESALFFPAGDSARLAATIERLLTEDQLYARLSANSLRTWERLQLPVEWSELLTRWIRKSADDKAWLRRHSVAEYDYDRPAAVLSGS